MPQDSFSFLLSSAARLVRRRFDTRARALGVSRAQWQVLFALAQLEGSNQTMLADHLEVETITLCRMVDRLTDAGLVERRPDSADRRAWRLYLTETGRPLLAQLRDLGAEVIHEALAGIPEGVCEMMIDGLVQLRVNLSTRPDVRASLPGRAAAIAGPA